MKKTVLKCVCIFFAVLFVFNIGMMVPVFLYKQYPIQATTWFDSFKDCCFNYDSYKQRYKIYPAGVIEGFEYWVPWNYFSKNTEYQLLKGDMSIEDVLFYSDIYYGKFEKISYSVESNERATFLFKHSGGRREFVSRGCVHEFYSREELALYQAGRMEYEEGKHYLVFCSIFDNSMFLEGDDKNKVAVYAPLDEEYPYIEIYPGATRYDATYFGAASKDVTKEEFVELVTAYADSL